MQAETVSTVRTQVLERFGDGPKTVIAGPMFDKNLWNVLQLEHINVTALSETVIEMYKDGLLMMSEGTIRRSGVADKELDTNVEAGVLRYGNKQETQRTYMLSERGRQLLQRHLDSRNNMP